MPTFIRSLLGACLAVAYGVYAQCSYNMSNTTVDLGSSGCCSGADFYDSGGPSGDYTNNQNLVMTFRAPFGQRVRLEFSAFNTEANWDWLEVYDGPNTGSPLLGRFSGTTVPGPFTSSGSALTVRFTSDGSVVSSGWAARVSCVPPPPACTFTLPPTYQNIDLTANSCCGGAVFYDSGGEAGGYGDGEDRMITFSAPASQRLSAEFGVLDILSGDTLYVHDGPDAAAPVIARLSGNTPQTIRSTGRYLTFRFVSDAAGTAGGWVALLQCFVPCQYRMQNGVTVDLAADVCCSGANFYDSGGPGGSTTTSNASGNYGNNENAVMTFTAPPGQHVRVEFSAFTTESGYDSLEVFDGPNTSAPRLGRFMGTTLPPTLISSSNTLTFRFRSDGSVNRLGWEAALSCVSPAATCIFPMSTQTVDLGAAGCCGLAHFYDDGGLGGNYSASASHVLTFRAPSGQGVEVRFNTFALGAGDELRVYDGASTSAPLIGTYTGSTLPPLLRSTRSALTFEFISDAADEAAGWFAVVRCYPRQVLMQNGTFELATQEACGGIRFYDTGGPEGNYANNENLTLTFLAPPGQFVRVQFNSFNTQLNQDTLEVFDGPDANATRLGVYSGTSLPPVFISSTEALTFRFRSNASVVAAGWEAVVSCATPPPACIFNMQTAQVDLATNSCCGVGVFYDDGGVGGNYGDNVDDTLTFIAPTGQGVEVRFIAFALLDGDTLYVYDGANTSAPLIGAYSGTNLPPVIRGNRQRLTFRFVSNASGNAAGWAARIACYERCVYTMPRTGSVTVSIEGRDCCSGLNFFDSGGPGGSATTSDQPGNYANGENGVVTFTAPVGQHVRVEFSAFTTENNFDSLEVFDGADVNAPRLGRFMGSILPPTLLSSQNALTFRFQSDGIANRLGWAASVTCVSPPPGCIFNLSTRRVDLGALNCCGLAHFYDDGGSGADYGNGVDDTLTFEAPAGQGVEVRFFAFNLAEGDTLYVYDGADVNAPLLGAYSGTNLPPAIRGNRQQLTFRFVSNASGTAAGWGARVGCYERCTFLMPVTGTTTVDIAQRDCCGGLNFFDSGGPSSDYSNSQNATVVFVAPFGRRVELSFSSFNTEQNVDTLEVFDGAGTTGTRLGRFSGNALPPTLASSGRALTVRFRSNSSTTAAGWAAQVRCIPMPAGCTFVLNAATQNVDLSTAGCCGGGVFYDSGSEAGAYGDNEDRQITFTAPSGQRVQVQFGAFNVAAGDTLYVHDGADAAAPLIARLSGTTLPSVIRSRSQSLTFRFVSNSSGTAPGWVAEVSCFVPCTYNMTNGLTVDLGEENCCGDLNFYDSGGPAGDYANNENQVMTFLAPLGQRLRLEFTAFNTETNWDWLEVYDGVGIGGTQLGRFSGTNVPASITSSGRALTIRFTSDASVVRSGWAARLTCVVPPAACTFTMPASPQVVDLAQNNCCGEAVFYDSGNIGGAYGDNENRIITFMAPQGQRAAFSFFQLELLDGDTLFVHDGQDANAPILARLSGNTPPAEPIRARGQYITFRFVSNGSGNAAGWGASISCFVPCIYAMRSGTIDLGAEACCDEVRFYDSGGPTGNYSNSESRGLTFLAPPRHRLRVVFSSFDSESCCDSLIVYDGADELTSPRLITLRGTPSMPVELLSTGNALTFRFRSDGSITRAGWEATISCIAPCSYTLHADSSVVDLTQEDCCGGANFYDSGGPNRNYGDNQNKLIIFQAPYGERIEATFSQFATEANQDILRVFDGFGRTASLVGQYSGTTLPPVIRSSGRYLTFEFRSSDNTNEAGWAAQLRCIGYPACTYLMPYKDTLDVDLAAANCCANGATFSDGGGPADLYLGRDTSVAIFRAPSDKRLKVTFSAFALGSGDTLWAYDGEGATARQIGAYYGSNLPPEITSTGAVLTFVFRADAADSLFGWVARVECEDLPPSALPGLPASPRVTLHPNPSRGGAWLEASIPIQRVRIWDVYGKLVWEGAEEKPRWYLEGLSGGVYTVEVHLSNGERTFLRWIITL
ncbi:MAG: CUB domain-containing protein [Bacteroidia bacterium]